MDAQKQPIPSAILSVWLLLGPSTAGLPSSAVTTGGIQAVEVVGMTVADVDRSAEFFSKVLSFEKLSERELWGSNYDRLLGVFGLRAKVVRMRLGDEVIELTEYLAPRGRPIPVDSRSNDRWFQHIAIIVSDMDRAYQVLRDNRVEHASPSPQRLPDWNEAAGGIRAFYFKDPDGHPLEILEFPEGKGDPKWHRATEELFLGIDHTAIVVRDTEESLELYRDRLGFRVAGESENYGPEQERLNNVFGARLRITALRAPEGPGIEFLEYLTPRDGRPMPTDVRSNDVFHWQTVLVTSDARFLESRLRRAKHWFVSTNVIDLEEGSAFLIRDPDGHALKITQR